AFFEPMLHCSQVFYMALHRRGDFGPILNSPRHARAEFRRVAELVRPREKVLDVGCGEATLAPYLAHATYVGLEPHAHATAAKSGVRCETIAQHPPSHPTQYDLLSAPHLADPASH